MSTLSLSKRLLRAAFVTAVTAPCIATDSVPDPLITKPYSATNLPTFHDVGKGPHKFYADPKTGAILGQSLIRKMNAVAQDNIFYANPHAVAHLTFEDWQRHPFFKNWLDIGKSPLISEKMAPELLAILERNYKIVALKRFINLVGDIRGTLGGNNYFADNNNIYDSGKPTGCMIAGDLNVTPQKVATILGGIPPHLQTPAYQKLFDYKSILTYVLLHEAAHCAQKNSSTPSDIAKRQSDNVEILRYEVDADEKADQAYNELVAAGEKLDPQMPEKIRALRIIAPALDRIFPEKPASPIALLIGLISSYTHSTAGIKNSGDDYNAAKTAQHINKAFTFFSITFLLEYSTPDRLAEAKAYADQSRGEFDAIFEVFKKELPDDSKTIDLNGKTVGLTELLKQYLSTIMMSRYLAQTYPDDYLAIAHQLDRGLMTEHDLEKHKGLSDFAAAVRQSWDVLKLKPVPADMVAEYRRRILGNPKNINDFNVLNPHLSK